MSNSPQWILLAAPFAVVGGISLRVALSSGTTIAWCVFTSCATSLLGILTIAGAYVRAGRGERRSQVRYLADWPEELDVLLSDGPIAARLEALDRIAISASDPLWPYRKESIQVLRHLCDSADHEIVPLARRIISALQAPQIQSPKQANEPLFCDQTGSSQNRRLLIEEAEAETLEGALARLILVPARKFNHVDVPERVELAIETARKNREDFIVNPKVIQQLLQRSRGKDWLQIRTVDELRLISTEPWVFLYPNSIRLSRDGLITVELTTLWQAHREFNKPLSQDLIGRFGGELLNAIGTVSLSHVTA